MLELVLVMAEAMRLGAEMAEREDRAMREALPPAEYAAWREKRDREIVEERRHRELCRSIEQAGKNARPSGFGVLW